MLVSQSLIVEWLILTNNDNIILQMKYLLFIVLVKLAFSLQLVAKSDLSTTILTPGYSTSLSDFHNIYQNQYLGFGTYWIWSNEGMNTPFGRQITFQTLFYTNCNGPITLNLTADQSFIVYVDGNMVGRGDNYVRVYSFPLKLSCGSHNLTISVTKGASSLGPGLIFAMYQDQSKCFNCNANGQWNDRTCSCQCITMCGCDSSKVWVAYPTCACICIQTIPNYDQYLIHADNQTSNSLIISEEIEGIKLPPSLKFTVLACPNGQRYSQGVCSCLCNQQYCGQKFAWNSNPLVCGCQRIAN